MARLKLTKEEKERLLQGIDEAERRLSKYQGEITWAEARLLLRETIGYTLHMISKNHISERMLS